MESLDKKYYNLGDDEEWNEEDSGMDIAPQATRWLDIPQHLQQPRDYVVLQSTLEAPRDTLKPDRVGDMIVPQSRVSWALFWFLGDYP